MRTAIALALVLASAVSAQTPGSDGTKRSTIDHYNLNKRGLAIEGHDPVAYFPEGGGEAAKGAAEHTLVHRGATYRFVSAANRERFTEDPERYEPAYGGWCAYAMADGDKVEVDPESFLIQGERLYLFYDGLFADTRKSWSKKPDEYQFDADVQWERLTGEDPARQRTTQEPRDVSKFNLGKAGLALDGWDPVSYFPKSDGSAGRPTKGKEQHVAVHRGAVYRFASAANRAAFLADPARYEPAYGGWCAYGMSQGDRVDVDPEAFRIDDGKLFVFYRKRKTDTRDEWRKDPVGLRAKADANWEKLGG